MAQIILEPGFPLCFITVGNILSEVLKEHGRVTQVRQDIFLPRKTRIRFDFHVHKYTQSVGRPWHGVNQGVVGAPSPEVLRFGWGSEQHGILEMCP